MSRPWLPVKPSRTPPSEGRKNPPAIPLDLSSKTPIITHGGQIVATRAYYPFEDSKRCFDHQATGPVIRVWDQAPIRVGGEQDHTAVLDC